MRYSLQTEEEERERRSNGDPGSRSHGFPGGGGEGDAVMEGVDAFRTSLRQSKDRPRYTFYNGPPFAIGLPHYGHILAGTIKVRVEGRVGRERRKNMLRRKRRRWYDFGMVKT